MAPGVASDLARAELLDRLDQLQGDVARLESTDRHAELV
jgi:hypothetical protein